MTITDEELDARLRALARPTPGIDPAAALALTEAAAGHAGKRRRRRNWIVPTAIVAVCTLAIPTSAIAERLFAAQTGEFGGNNGEEMFGDEWITSDAPDFAAYVATITPRELPVPPSFDWDAATSEVLARYTEPAQMQRILLRSDYEWMIWDAWIVEWLDADLVDDEARRSTAFNAMLEAPTWEGFVEGDGGGIRLSMWSSLLRYAKGDAEERTNVMQTLWQHAKGPVKVDGTPSPEFLKYWDGVDRQGRIEESVSGWDKITESYKVISHESPIWDEYERELTRIEAETRAAAGDAR